MGKDFCMAIEMYEICYIKIILGEFIALSQYTFSYMMNKKNNPI
jgi:hypothetical protein